MSSPGRPVSRVNVLSALAAATTAAVAYVLVLSLGSLPDRGWAVVIFTAPPVCAIAASYLLNARARSGMERWLHWPAAGLLAATVGLVLQLIGHPSVSPMGGPLNTSSNANAALYLAWHSLFALGVLAGAARLPAGRARLPLLGGAVALLFLLATDLLPLPTLFSSDGSYGAALRPALLGVLVLSAVATAWWTARAGVTPEAPSAWISVSAALLTAELVLNLLGAARYDALWWASVLTRDVAFGLLLVGLIVGIARELGGLERFTVTELERAEGRVRRSALATDLLLDASIALSRAVSEAEVAEALLDGACRVVGAPSGAMFAVDEERGALRLLATMGHDEVSRRQIAAQEPSSHSPEGRAARTGQPQFVETVEQAREYGDAGPSLLLGAGSLAAVPLLLSGTPVGVVVVLHPTSRPYPALERDLLVALAAQGSQALRRAQLYERQVSLAQSLQHSLLPERLPHRSDVSLAARYLPGARGLEVGGDWYDGMSLPDGRLALVVGDVMGKGIRAAAVMGQIRNAVRALAALDPEPAAVLAGLDRLAASFDDDEIVTVVYLLLDPAQGVAHIARAGHLPVLLVPQGCAPTFLPGGDSPPIGVPVASRDVAVAIVPAGALLLLFTDGLVEDRRTGLDVGLPALASTMGRLARAPYAKLDDLLDELVESTGLQTARSDDVTVLAARLETVLAPAPEADRVSAPPEQWRRAELSLRPQPESVPAARRFLSAQLRHWQVPSDSDAYDSALLCVSEMITNAVVHVGGEARLQVAIAGARLRLSVRDGSTSRPERRERDLLATGGRGMELLDATATAWGVEVAAASKTVWCEFDLPVPAALESTPVPV